MKDGDCQKGIQKMLQESKGKIDQIKVRAEERLWRSSQWRWPWKEGKILIAEIGQEGVCNRGKRPELRDWTNLDMLGEC